MPLSRGKHIGVSLVPVVVLVALLALDVGIFGADSILGPSQVSLLVASAVCVLLGVLSFKTPWADFEREIKKNVGDIAVAILILLLIGAISGTWTASGVVPMFICYGVKIISPRFFLLTACIICALVSVLTGSSWTTIATIGVALMGIGRAEGFSDGMIAGAVISGAYFGDKISPLSDTTVMASSVNGVKLFEHIRYMLITTVPSMTIALVIFTVLGLSHGGGDAGRIAEYTTALEGTFRITPWLLLVPAVTFLLIALKLPALVVLFISTVAGAAAALVFQPDIIAGIGAREGIAGWRLMFTGTVESIYNSVQIDTGSAAVNELVASRGMLGMLNTIYLILCAMCFGGCMRASGMIGGIAELILPLTRRRTGMVAGTVLSGMFLNTTVCDQYLSIILTSDIFRDVYKRNGYEAKLLSRSVEDSSTVTSPLIPWSSCGMTQSTILGVSTFAYLPYCFFNILSPLVSVTVAATGYRILKKKETYDMNPES